MDGVRKAEITQESDSELVDMMDWNTEESTTPLTSSFKIVWDLKNTTERPVGLRRVTIGYAHEGFDLKQRAKTRRSTLVRCAYCKICTFYRLKLTRALDFKNDYFDSYKPELAVNSHSVFARLFSCA